MNINKITKMLIFSLIIVLSSSTYLLAGNNTQTIAPIYKPYSAENGSYRGKMSERTHRPKNVYVPAYKHRDGSRVRSHYRSKRK